MENTKVAAIVLNYNGFEDTVECVRSLLDIDNHHIKVYLIDNASSDDSGEKLREHFAGVKYYRLDDNRGYAAGNNFGLKQAYNDGFDYFLIVNNDVVIDGDILTPMLNVMRDHPDTGIVTCKVLYKNYPGTINTAGGKFDRLLCTGVNLRIGERNTETLENKYVDFVPGVLLFIKKEVLKEVGFMEERFFMYFEDMEYSMRVNKHFKMYYTSEATIYHKSGGGIKGRSYTVIYLYYHTRNRLWLFRNQIVYFPYVIVFSTLNCMAKTVIICREFLDRSITFHDTMNKIKYLWLGFIHGLFMPSSGDTRVIVE